MRVGERVSQSKSESRVRKVTALTPKRSPSFWPSPLRAKPRTLLLYEVRAPAQTNVGEWIQPGTRVTLGTPVHRLTFQHHHATKGQPRTTKNTTFPTTLYSCSSMPETILVVGATGMLGEPVARRLAEDGHTVRVMSRNLDRLRGMFDQGTFEAVQGDVDDAESLREAMDGCTGVHLNLAGNGDWDLERRGAQVASKVASETAGMKRITTITGASTCDENAWFPGTKAKLEAENALKASGVPYTIFRCTMFMETLPKWVQGNKAFIVGDQPTPWHWIAAQDYASMVSKSYSAPEAANKTFYAYGPQTLTMEEALNIYIPTCAPDAKISNVPFWFMRLFSWVSGKAEIRTTVIPLFEYFHKVRELGNEADIAEANSVIGAPTITVQAWCEAYIAKK